ncbi:hypothetical protein [Halobacterium wangiae]|uniref:hypothetical protein n=1 Tax=Halobacterium wangiae TaxID=2902623 RepID=UPI001E3A509D|nr:hypothetical protein [Halobacterium wangiae]
MSRRFRWTRPLPDGDTVTITRVVGDHEEDADGRQRRYTLTFPAGSDASVEPTAGVRTAVEDGTHWVTVGDGAGLPRVRLRVGAATTGVRLPGPTFDERCTDAVGGDRAAARDLLDAVAGPVALAFACGELLDPGPLTDLLDTVTAANGTASDDVHAARYDLLRTAVTTPAGPTVDSREGFETLAEGLDAAEAIGDVDSVDALADATFVACDSPGEARTLLNSLGYDLRDLESTDDGRFLSYYLAHVAATAGVSAAKHDAANRSTELSSDEATTRAENADYWERGAAWRDAVVPAADRSFEEFAYVLANALYWTGETGRGDSRADELCFAGAAAAARTIDLEWVVGHARFEQARAVGHRHRSKRNHALALTAFKRARHVAGEYSFLDPWEPTYSHAVVASNRHSTAGDHGAAVEALEDGREALEAQDIPAGRREEMVAHLDAQRHERSAILADDPESKVAHLESAVERYETVAFDRSLERVRQKLNEARDAADEAVEQDADSGRELLAGVPRRTLRADRRTGPTLADIPTLHDFLTEPDPDAVGSADPGVLPDEREGGDEFGNPGPLGY